MKVISILKDICIFLAVLPLVILILISAAISSIWKVFIFLLVRILHRGKCISFLGPIDIFFYSMETKESIHSYPRLCIPVTILLEGHLGEEELKEHFQTQVINCRDEQGRLVFGRLQQKIVRKLGYLFFAKDDHFQITNHIRTMEIPLDEAGLLEFIGTQTCAPFKSNSPLWEIILVPNYNGEDKTLFFLRTHHILMDGASIFVLFQRGITNKVTNSLKESSKLTTPTVHWSLRQAVAQAYENTIGMPRKFFLEQAGRKNLRTKSVTEKVFLFKTEQIPLEKFKRLKATRGISFTTAVFTAVSSALSKFFSSGSCQSEGMEYLTGLFTFPASRNPNNVGNNFILADVNFPAKPMKLEERMEKCRVEMEKTKNAVSPKVIGMMMAVGNVFPVDIFLKYFLPTVADTEGLIVSNMPAGTTSTRYLGRTVIDVSYSLFAKRNTWIAFSICSYNGNISIAICGSQNTFERESDFHALCSSFMESLDNILECTINPKSTFIIQMEK